ncbi:MAG: MauE/DoxX family redox-associated membrane protein [Acidobacteriota bacterium]
MPSPAQSSANLENPAPAAWRRALSVAGCVVLGAVFLVASWAKSIDPSAFADQIRSEGLEIVLSAQAVALIALFLEWFLGMALVLAIRRPIVLVPSSLLVAFFMFLTGRKYWRWSNGEEVAEGCGCFGNLVDRTPAEAFWQDLLLMVPALLLSWLALEAGRSPRWRLGAATVVGVAMTVFAWRAPHLPIDDLATRLKPGIDPFKLCVGGSDSPEVCMDAILPELESGEHMIILADLSDESFAESVPAINDYSLNPDHPALWVLSSADEDELFTFRFTHGPIFQIREIPSPLMRPLYRQLPRSFTVVGGVVTETWAGLPPMGSAGAEPGSASQP